MAPRQRMREDVRQSAIDPARRNGTRFRPVRLAETLIARIDAYMLTHELASRPAAIRHAFDLAEGIAKTSQE